MMIAARTGATSRPLPPPPSPLLLLLAFVCCHIVDVADAQLLEVFGISTGRAGTVDRAPIEDIASQSIGLVNYLQSVQRAQKGKKGKGLLQLPAVNFIDGLPAVPGLTGSLPGAGACLPQGAPLVRQNSPSFFQNILRNIPGAQDYLSSLLPSPNVNLKSLFGRYYWAIDTPAVHDKYCPTTELRKLADAGNASTFTVVDKFRTSSPQGGEKTAFGYGIKHRERIYLYFQDDPCPYQIMVLGPVHKPSGQYEYVILSNWARFPVIGLVRDLKAFHMELKSKMERELAEQGLINKYTRASSLTYIEWSQCYASTPLSYVRNVLQDLFG